jgi:chemotaxis protein methyltransferase CheR
VMGPRITQRPGQASSLTGADREFDLSSADFDRIRQLIYRYAGIALSDLKHDLVYGRLSRRLRASGLDRFSAYLDLVEARDGPEREAFINALTTNLTSFFREAHHFTILSEQWHSHAPKTPFKVWCSACSTGEEAYSLAITLAETCPKLDAFEIWASDLDTQVLARARDGIYGMDRVEGFSQARLKRFFLKGHGAHTGKVRVKADLISRIHFERINLLMPIEWPQLPVFDAIFCRNVMIYFDKPTQRRLLECFSPLLAPHGRLYCGHSESLLHCADLFKNLGRTVYAPVSKGMLER